jgi:hypothetical protein
VRGAACGKTANKAATANIVKHKLAGQDEDISMNLMYPSKILNICVTLTLETFEAVYSRGMHLGFS